MSSLGTLWTVPQQDTGKTIRAVAALAGLELSLPESYTHFEDNKKPEFTSKFPAGKIPALEAKDGFKLFEGAAIARYVASLAPNSGLLGNDLKEAALVDQWVHYVESEVGEPNYLIFRLVKGYLTPYSKPLHTAFSTKIETSLAILESHLATRTFFVGERITLADITVASHIQRAGAVVFDASLRAKFPNVTRHFETIVNQPKLKDIYAPIELIDKALQFTAPVKEKAKPAAAPTPKAEKKPKATEADDEEDNLVPAEPKTKNPLDDLPKSTFNLEDWKRAYSNKETRGPGSAVEWFYQNYDPAGFSVWRVDFKYNSELTQTFMSSNQIGGFFNRLEASRKYLFGSVGVLGTANDSVISGVLVIRGSEVQPVVDAAPDWESYEYKKLDLEDSAQKTFFEAALAWDLEIDGKKWVDGKNFK